MSDLLIYFIVDVTVTVCLQFLQILDHILNILTQRIQYDWYLQQRQLHHIIPPGLLNNPPKQFLCLHRPLMIKLIKHPTILGLNRIEQANGKIKDATFLLWINFQYFSINTDGILDISLVFVTDSDIDQGVYVEVADA